MYFQKAPGRQNKNKNKKTQKTPLIEKPLIYTENC
jgi:hypothetical protein